MYTPNIHIQYLGKSKELYGEAGLIAATPYSAGFDLRAYFEEDFIKIEAGERYKVHCGVAFDMQALEDKNHHAPLAGFVYSRSGLGAKEGLTVAQGVGVIDPDYRGEIMVYLLNTSKETKRIERGDRIAQIIFQPYFSVTLVEAETLSESTRGKSGYGHSGVK